LTCIHQAERIRREALHSLALRGDKQGGTLGHVEEIANLRKDSSRLLRHGAEKERLTVASDERRKRLW